MPMYEYQCAACGHQMEALQKFSDKPLKSCPKCKKAKLEKLLSKSAIQFKGSGWYITDYAKKSSPDTTKSEKDSGASESKNESAKESASESSGDTKSTAKEAAKPAASSASASKAESGKGSASKK